LRRITQLRGFADFVRKGLDKCFNESAAALPDPARKGLAFPANSITVFRKAMPCENAIEFH
jgi:hypothetical protein